MPTYTITGTADGNGNTAATSIVVDVSGQGITDGDYVWLGVNANDTGSISITGNPFGSPIRDVDTSADATVTGVNSETSRCVVWGKTALSEPTSYTVDLGTSRNAQVIVGKISSSNGANATWSISDAAVTLMDATGPGRLMVIDTDGQVIPADSAAIWFVGADNGTSNGAAYDASQAGTPAEMTFLASDGNHGRATAAYYVNEPAGVTLSGETQFEGPNTTDYTYGIYFAVEDTFVASSDPTITDAGDEAFNDGETGVVITGTNFEAVQGTGTVIISPTDSVADGSAVTQTVTSWADTSITITVAQGALAEQTNMYLFVTNDTGDSNVAGYVVQFNDQTAPTASAPTAVGSTSSTITVSADTNETGGTMFARLYADGSTPLDTAVYAGTGALQTQSVAVSSTGTITPPAFTGLPASTDYEAFLFHRDAGSNDSNVVTVAVSTDASVKTLELTAANNLEFRDEDGALVTNVTGVNYEWYDTDGSTAGAAVDTGTFNIDGSGEASFSISNSVLTNGQFGTLIFRDPVSNTIRGNWRVPITVT